MTDLLQPLTPADCDLRDFPFMPLDVVRLRDSDLAVTADAEEFRCAVLLWCASWHQVPAASLPDDDKALAQYAGYGRVVKEWMKVREGALRGWVKCMDNRLYHPVVAEKANTSWIGKLRQRLKTECARIKKHNDRHGTNVPFPEFDSWMCAGCPVGQKLFVPRDTPKLSLDEMPPVPRETPSKGEGEGEGEVNLRSKPRTDPARANTDSASPIPASAASAVGSLCVAMRSSGVETQPADPRMIALAAQGVLPETVAAACAEAKKSKPGERITPGYVLAILSRWSTQAAALDVGGATQPRAGPLAVVKFDPVAHVNRNRIQP